jgi:pentatricopeptide repeat protein
MGLYRGMRAAGLHADAYTLTALMTACERVGKWDTGAQLLSQLKAGGVAPNLHHHNCLLNAYGRAGRWEQVLRSRL